MRTATCAGSTTDIDNSTALLEKESKPADRQRPRVRLLPLATALAYMLRSLPGVPLTHARLTQPLALLSRITGPTPVRNMTVCSPHLLGTDRKQALQPHTRHNKHCRPRFPLAAA